MRILVTGSRQWLDRPTMYDRLDAARAEWLERWVVDQNEQEVFTVVHGGAAGADTMAGEWVWDRRLESVPPVAEVHPADWSRGMYAGHNRNYEMVTLGADLVLGFLQAGASNTGTRRCLEEAERWLGYRGVPIEKIWSEV